MGGYKVQGKSVADYEIIMAEALAVEAGCLYAGIGWNSGAIGQRYQPICQVTYDRHRRWRYTDGQVLVINDLLGQTDLRPKFVKTYSEINSEIIRALGEYNAEIKAGTFPAEEQYITPLQYKGF
jgi:3-methyl-2-oxobutanoate hydroxymethyltransferase